jgi:small subunit ribosomal protein S21
LQADQHVDSGGECRRRYPQNRNELLRIWLPAGRVAFAAPSEETHLQVLVRDNNVEQALRVLKKKMQREGVFREMKQRRSYEKPSERKTREKSEAIRRARKLARKQAIREGLLPAPPKKKPFERKPPLPAVKDRGTA